MKKTHGLTYLVFTLFLSAFTTQATPLGKLNGVMYRTGKWNKKLGDQRILVEVKGSHKKAVRVQIQWRKESKDKNSYELHIVGPKQGVIKNRTVLNRSSSALDLVFEPSDGAGIYAVYYWLPDPEKTKGFGPSSFPQTYYKMYSETANKTWLLSAKKTPIDSTKVIAFEALERKGPEALKTFNSFYPMEVALTPTEKAVLMKSHAGEKMVLFPEDRNHSIRMTDDLPVRWLKKKKGAFVVDAARGQYTTYQIGVWALEDLLNVQLVFSDLKGSAGVISKDKMTCFNLSGIDWEGHSFTKKVGVKKGKVQPLWCGIDLPIDVAAGTYHGQVEVIANDGSSKKFVSIALEVKNEILENRGDNDPWNFSRLRWFNSTIGLDDKPVQPYLPVKVKSANQFSILGRTVQLGALGLPSQATSYISLEKITKNGRDILASPMEFLVKLNNKTERFSMQPVTLLKQMSGKVIFQTTGQSKNGLNLCCKGTLESDGYMRYTLSITAQKSLLLSDAVLIIPFKKEVAKYAMGVFGTSGAMPKEMTKKFPKGIMYNVVWGGDFNAGMGCWLKNENEEWNADNASKENVPALNSWASGTGGGYQLVHTKDSVRYEIHLGKRMLEKNVPLNLDFALMITPFKPLTDFRWTKIYHPQYGRAPDNKKGAPADVVDLHHATAMNPYINYPFIVNKKLKAAADFYHGRNQKMRIYYTIRELSILAPELWMMRSLDNEIFVKDSGYIGSLNVPNKQIRRFGKYRFVRSGYPWMCEHLIDNYRVRWHSYFKGETDASIAMQGLSRWHNYYLEGLKWLIQNEGIDGLYLDGIGYDREIMKRVRKTMVEAGNPCSIDFHGALHFAWLTQAPFVDSLWYGEGAKYNAGPDYWLVEVSGIPFGLGGGILARYKSKTANHFRGMIYGCIRRTGWGNSYESIELWNLWDQFKIKDAEQLGYWDSNCPVQTNNEKIKATVYRKEKECLIVLASWAKETQSIRLKIDWKALGLNPTKIKSRLPEIKFLQEESSNMNLNQSINIPENGGMIIWIQTN